MGVFDWFKPLDKVLGTIDKAVVDQDLKLQLKSELEHAQIELRRLAQETYLAELGIQTVPWVDALHKMGRQIISLVSILACVFVMVYMSRQGQTVTFETMLALLAGTGPGGIYNAMKGKGNKL